MEYIWEVHSKQSRALEMLFAMPGGVVLFWSLKSFMIAKHTKIQNQNKVRALYAILKVFH